MPEAETPQTGGPETLGPEERDRRSRALEELMELMRPAVQADGGELVVTSVDYERGIVDVQLQGACGSCAISGATLQGGVERLLKQRLEWVSEVRGSVDESMDFFESVSLGRGGYVPRS
ncbi:MAG: NifU family protein [Acidimicrobiales bacterium]